MLSQDTRMEVSRIIEKLLQMDEYSIKVMEIKASALLDRQELERTMKESKKEAS